MTRKPKFLPLLLLALVPMLNVVSTASAADPAAASSAQPLVQHKIQARIDPDAGTIAASDELVLPAGAGQVQLHLHAGLSPEVIGGEAVLERIGRAGHLERFRLTPDGPGPITLRYGGRIRHDLQAVREGMGRARQQTIGTIDADGVFLSGYTGWYPSLPGSLVTFTLDVELPPGWLAVSQGAGPVVEDRGRSQQVRWQERQPQDEIHLAAAPFKLYRQQTPVAEAQAYLRLPDDALAQRYLDVTADYLTRYSRLIGDYPYDKFALVENFWETGYGMPSFTLLGSRVLRLPFILHSSYPHEILHNWWGNGVYVDYSSGNWSEGLTAYLADHLNQALEGRGDDYRRDQLKAYADYVRDASDFPLTEFRGRHGSASQAIGYGKTLMLFHMLRVQLGDEAFIRGLQRFYRDNLFRTASWADVETAFERAADADLGAFFKAWTTRPGAPTLTLTDVRTEPSPEGGWTVRGRIVQDQPGAPFPMTVPVVVHAERGEPRELRLELTGRSTGFEVALPAPPMRVAVDPRFDVFRALHPEESPVSLSNLFGAERGLILLPAAAEDAFADAWRGLAKAWQQGHPGWTIATDAEIDALPADRAVWLLGWDNRFLTELKAAGAASARFDIDASQRRVTLDDQDHTGTSPVLTTRIAGQPVAWVAAATPAAVPGLARKLPHYGKYGYLVFTGAAPDNQVKGQWPVGDSRLMHWFVDDRPMLKLPARAPLTEW
jgi:hypothetical protein